MKSQKMTPKELVYAAIRHEETDFTPYALWIGETTENNLNEYYGDNQWKERIIDHYLRNDTVEGDNVVVGENLQRDRFGVVWETQPRDLGVGHMVELTLPEPSLEGYEIPSLCTEEDLKRIQTNISANPDRFNVTGPIGTLFDRCWMLRGMENFLMDVIENPRFVNELLDRLLEKHLEAYDALGTLEGVDALFLGDDYGAQRGVIIGEPYWRKYLKPRVKAIFEHCKSLGKHTWLHSCGDNSPIVGDLIDCGLDVYHPFQPEPQDVYALKREYGKDITFCGGLSTQQLLPQGTPKEIRAETKRLCEVIGKGGGYILQPAKEIRADVPLENALVCIEAFTEQNW